MRGGAAAYCRTGREPKRRARSIVETDHRARARAALRAVITVVKADAASGDVGIAERSRQFERGASCSGEKRYGAASPQLESQLAQPRRLAQAALRSEPVVVQRFGSGEGLPVAVGHLSCP